MTNYLKILFAFAGLLVILAACNKNENDLMPEHTANDPTTEKILAFKAKLDQADKIDETMSIDSAVWYIEAALNYTHCVMSQERIDAKTNMEVNDTFTVDVNLTNGKVFTQNVLDSYRLLETNLLNQLNTYNYQTKFYKIVDVEFNKTQFQAVATLGYKKEAKAISEYYINDNWYWGFFIGNCSQTITEGDATNEIEKWYISRYYMPWLSQSGSVGLVYYTDVHFNKRYYNPIEGNPNPGIDLTPYGLYAFSLYSPTPIPSNELPTWYCMNATTCTWYAEQSLLIFELIENNFLETDEVITKATLNWATYQWGEPGNLGGTQLFHYYSVWAGKKHSIGGM